MPVGDKVLPISESEIGVGLVGQYEVVVDVEMVAGVALRGTAPILTGAGMPEPAAAVIARVDASMEKHELVVAAGDLSLLVGPRPPPSPSRSALRSLADLLRRAARELAAGNVRTARLALDDVWTGSSRLPTGR